ncbi:MAG: NAD-dependent epimerase/dehydratase family protein [Candidatus Sumerlaeia bacterium]
MAERLKVLVTGGAGLIGRTLVPMLTNFCDVTHYDIAETHDGCPHIEGDVRDYEKVEMACEGMDMVVHMAALHGPHWWKAGDEQTFEINVIGTRNVLEAAGKQDVRRVVYTSSLEAQGYQSPDAPFKIDEEVMVPPDSLYGLTKVLGEEICRYATAKYGISTLCMRPGWVQSLNVPKEKYGAKLSGAVDVRDAAQAHALALKAPESLKHEAFIVAGDSPLGKADAEKICEHPMETIEKLMPGFRELVEQEKFTPPEPLRYCSIEKARKILGYEPNHSFDLKDYQ